MNLEIASPDHDLLRVYTGWLNTEIKTQGLALDDLKLPEAEAKKRRGMLEHKVRHIRDCIKASEDIGIHPLLAHLLAITHDYSRFQQAALYGDFSDKRSGFPHAYVGALRFMAFNPKEKVRDFGLDPYAVAEAIYWHSDLSYDGETVASLLARDMDKLALLRAYEDQLHHIQTNANLRPGMPTPTITENYRQKQLIKSSEIETTGDAVLLSCAWVFDLNFQSTKDIIRREDLIPQMLQAAGMYDFIDQIA